MPVAASTASMNAASAADDRATVSTSSVVPSSSACHDTLTRMLKMNKRTGSIQSHMIYVREYIGLQLINMFCLPEAAHLS